MNRDKDWERNIMEVYCWCAKNVKSVNSPDCRILHYTPLPILISVHSAPLMMALDAEMVWKCIILFGNSFGQGNDSNILKMGLSNKRCFHLLVQHCVRLLLVYFNEIAQRRVTYTCTTWVQVTYL